MTIGRHLRCLLSGARTPHTIPLQRDRDRGVRHRLPLIVMLVLIVLLLVIKTGFEGRQQFVGSEKTTAVVVSVNNERVHDTGLVKVGEQTAHVRINGGRFAGQETSAVNPLNGSLETDKLFKVGDVARVVIDHDNTRILATNLIDHDRMPYEIGLAALFALLLIAVAGRTGLRALLSFVLAVLCIGKVLTPAVLKGAPPMVVGLLLLTVLTVLIIASVYGVSWKTAAAVSGSMLGIATTAGLSILGTTLFRIHGAVMAKAESLLYAGFGHLHLTAIFMTGIVIGASGAIMDLAVDITSATAEVVAKKPTMGWREAFRSAMNVGRAAMGTMTTTLLFAYSGGYMALSMVFMAQGTPLLNILNYKDVAAEILHTLIGSFGLATVAPFTAFVAARLLTTRGKAELVADEARAREAAACAETQVALCTERCLASADDSSSQCRGTHCWKHRPKATA